ncbi:MAG: transcription termination/antitermination protein NusA [Dehalococcoidia bacterium]|nr:transcription termination/antitermination protein NusA [Dehalococcoidia bacterium]
MKSDFLLAISQLAAEKNLAREIVFEAVEAALSSAYRGKDENSNVYVRIDPDAGDIHYYSQKTVVEEVEDDAVEISVAQAKRYKPDAQEGDVLDFEMPIPDGAGRIAAQTAKQVVLQRLREAERDAVYEEYSGKEGEIIVGTVQRIEPRQAIIELSRGTEATLPSSEQVRNEHLRAGQRLKVIILKVERATKGPQVIVSRSHRSLLRRLFELEVPEIKSGTVEIKSIAREGGHRSKVAVHSRLASVDPIGACVGMRGSRIQNIVNELTGERIDVIKWDPDAGNFVSNALSPAQVIEVEIDEDEHRASVVVPDRMLSLAIGKEGQNARLAAKLTGWRIDISSQAAKERGEEAAPSSFAPFAPGEEPDIDIIEEAEEVAAAAEAAPALEPVEVAATPAAEVELPAAPAAEEEEEVLSFAAAVDRMAIPDREEREAEDYGEEDEEEYEVPTMIVPEERPSAIRFAEDVLPRQVVEEEPKKPVPAKRPKRAPRFEEEEDEDYDYSGRIH